MQGGRNGLFEIHKEVRIELATWNIRTMDRVKEDLKRTKIVGWRAKVEDRQGWNRIVGQTETHRGL